MPNVTSTGTYDKASGGFSELAKTKSLRKFIFAGSDFGTTCELKYTDDGGTDRTFEGGTITTQTELELSLNADLKVVVTGGSPNFNVSIYSDG